MSVRLACLIHAANVHSEPGSNPSQMSRSPLRSSRIHRSFPPVSDPHPKGLRKKTGRTSLRIDRINWPGSLRLQDPQFVPPETCAGPCEPSRRQMTWGPPRPGVTESTARTPASLKGNLTRRIFTYLVSFWLTNAIDRIVKERTNAHSSGS